MLLSLFLIALTLFASSCAFRSVLATVPVPLPASPVLIDCPVKPLIEGKIGQFDGHGDAVILTKENAIKLQTYLQELELCMVLNLVILEGHIDKLENRLKAIGGDR